VKLMVRYGMRRRWEDESGITFMMGRKSRDRRSEAHEGPSIARGLDQRHAKDQMKESRLRWPERASRRSLTI